ncbi:hypothetical protein D9M71_696840 [compost metagenome]
MVRVDGDADRQALHYLGEIAAGVVGFEHGELRAGGRCNLLDLSVQLPALERVNRERRRLADFHVPGLAFLEIGDHPQVVRHQEQQLAAGSDVLPQPHRCLGNLSIARRLDHRVVQVDLRQLQRRLGVGDLGFQTAS